MDRGPEASGLSLRRTSQSAATICGRKGIASQSTGADTLGKRRQCQTCSTDVRRCKPKGLLCWATSRILDSGSVGRTVHGLVRFLSLA